MPSDCTSIDALVTPYVDGELPAPDRQRVDDHVRACPPCRVRVAAEDAARQLVHGRKATLTAARAPGALRHQCALMARMQGEPAATPAVRAASQGRGAWWSTLVPLALAASLVAVAGAAFLYRATDSSNRLMAAELTADHVKCFGMDDLLGTHDSPAVVETSMLSGFDWHTHAPAELNQAGLDLVGSRPCLYARGKVAHLMYRYQGRPVSIFMLPGTARADDLVEVFGHEAVIWSVGDRSFVLIARGTRDEVARMASFVRGSLQ
jgi:anti-sigma factor RsiW